MILWDLDDLMDRHRKAGHHLASPRPRATGAAASHISTVTTFLAWTLSMYCRSAARPAPPEPEEILEKLSRPRPNDADAVQTALIAV